ncbi:MAG: ribosome maturation factor RimM [Mastigocoleus sp.]
MDNWIEIGKIVAPQGLYGEMRVYPQTDFPERFEIPGTRWLLREGATQPETVELQKGRFLEGKKLYVISLAGFDSRHQVEELRGSKLLVPESDRPQLAPGEYHVVDLIGVSVFVQESGELLGKVVDVIAAGNDLLEVELDKQPENRVSKKGKKLPPKTVLIPFVEAIAPVVDLKSQRIEIAPPSGLLEI